MAFSSTWGSSCVSGLCLAGLMAMKYLVIVLAYRGTRMYAKLVLMVRQSTTIHEQFHCLYFISSFDTSKYAIPYRQQYVLNVVVNSYIFQFHFLKVGYVRCQVYYRSSTWIVSISLLIKAAWMRMISNSVWYPIQWWMLYAMWNFQYLQLVN